MLLRLKIAILALLLRLTALAQSPLAFVRETLVRFTSSVPDYWRRLQLLAGSVAGVAYFLLEHQAYVAPFLLPHLSTIFTVGTVIALMSQLPCRDKHERPSDVFKRELTGGSPPTLPTTGLEAPQKEETA